MMEREPRAEDVMKPLKCDRANHRKRIPNEKKTPENPGETTDKAKQPVAFVETKFQPCLIRICFYTTDSTCASARIYFIKSAGGIKGWVFFY